MSVSLEFFIWVSNRISKILYCISKFRRTIHMGFKQNKTARIRAKPWMSWLPFKVYGAVIICKIKCNERKYIYIYIFKIWVFWENQPPTRHIKYKVIDFAPSNKSIIAKKLPTTNDFSDGLNPRLRFNRRNIYCALIVPTWLKRQSLNHHNFTKKVHRWNIFSNLSSKQQYFLIDIKVHYFWSNMARTTIIWVKNSQLKSQNCLKKKTAGA